MIDVIDKQIINSLTNSKFKIKTYNEVSSTNTIIKELASLSFDEGVVVIANSQTKGKGRYNREFISKNGGIYLSILLRPHFSREFITNLTPMTAVAVCKSLNDVGVYPQIKWVNDIYISNKKVCGILTESSFRGSEIDYVIVGVGINLYQIDFPNEIKDIACGIFKDEEENLKNRVISNFLNSFWNYYQNIEKNEFYDFYVKNNLVLGRNISFLQNNREYFARAQRISENFNLEIIYENGVTDELLSEEIRSVRW